MCGAGDPSMKDGLCIYNYTFSTSMSERSRAFCNADGDMLIVPQQGALLVLTEMGRMEIEPGEIAVVQRGIRFSVDMVGKPTSEDNGSAFSGCRGYVLEVFKGHFQLPDLGPIGANGLANPRDFLTPTACFEDKEYPPDSPFIIIQKFQGQMFQTQLLHSPFDVVAWHGTVYILLIVTLK
jgi:homogentisate 1,2-dioxygenase